MKSKRLLLGAATLTATGLIVAAVAILPDAFDRHMKSIFVGEEHVYRLDSQPEFLTEELALVTAWETLQSNGFDTNVWRPVPDDRSAAPDGRKDEYLVRNTIHPNSGNMHTSPATEEQLSKVQEALDAFRTYWQSLRAMPSGGNFSGTLEDIHDLDYLDYEGLGYPSCGIYGAALVWGNVLACQLEMLWVTDSDDHLLLKHDVPGSRIIVWPYARVFEVQGRSLPQFEKYAWVLEAVIRDCIEYGDLSDRGRDWAQMVVAKTLALP